MIRIHRYSQRVKCPYSELFWSVFSSIRITYGEVQSISLNSVRMRENTDENNSKYGHLSRSDCFFFVKFSHTGTMNVESLKCWKFLENIDNFKTYLSVKMFCFDVLNKITGSLIFRNFFFRIKYDLKYLDFNPTSAFR